MSASKCKMFFSPTLWWSSKIAACVSAVWQGSSRSLELLSLPFQDVISVFLLLSYFSMDKKTTLIQKPLWKASLFPVAHHKVSLCDSREVQRGSVVPTMVTQQIKRDSPTLAFGLWTLSMNCFSSLTFRNNQRWTDQFGPTYRYLPICGWLLLNPIIWKEP